METRRDQPKSLESSLIWKALNSDGRTSRCMTDLLGVLFAILPEALPSILQPAVIGSGFLRDVMRHTVKNSGTCASSALEKDCLNVLAARAHRFVAVLGFIMTALAWMIFASSLLVRAGAFVLSAAVIIWYVGYIRAEDVRAEKPPLSWYDRNREFVYGVAYAILGLGLSCAALIVQ